MRLSWIARIVSKNITIDSQSTLEVQIFSLDCTDKIIATLIVTPSEISGTSYRFTLTVDGCEVTTLWTDSFFGILRYVGEKEYKTNRNYIAALAKKGFDYDEIIRISNEMYESIMLMQELERDAKAEHAASVEEESTVDTVSRENLVKFEVGKFYWASQGHRAYVVKRTANYITFNLFKVHYDGGCSVLSPDAMISLKMSNVRKKVTLEKGTEICHYNVDWNCLGYIEILSNGLIEMPPEEDEEEITIDYKFDVEEEDDDDELIDPPEESEVEETEMNTEIADYQWKIDVNRKSINDAEVFIEDTRNKYFFDEKTRNDLIESSKNEIAQSEKKIAEYEAAIAILKGVDNAASVDEVKVEETETDAEIAAMEKEVERKKRLVEYKTTVTFPQRLKRFSEQLINLYAQIAEIENEMWDYQLYAEEVTEDYETEIAALEAEIFNRKMIDAQEYINVSEEAFNISVQAEIDAANNVKAIENLKQAALNTAVTEVEPVSFAIERFNEGEVETAAEVVDTSITSVAEVPIVDAYAEIEDEIKCKLEAIEGLKAEVEALREQLKDIKKKDAPIDEESALFEEYKTLDAEVDESYRKFFFKRETLNETRRKLTNVLQKKFEPYVYLFNGLVEKASDNDAEIILYSQDGKGYDIAEGNWEEFDIYLDFANSPKYIITYRLLHIAEYQTLDAIKAAIEGLAAAIERGDKEYKFPADNSAQKK